MAERWRPDPQQGVFETMLVVDGHPIDLDAHRGRLEASLARLFPGHEPPPLDVAAIDHLWGGSIAGTSGLRARMDNSLSSLRVTVAPSEDGRLVADSEMREVNPGASTPLFGKKAPGAGVSLHSLELAGGLGAHKWADRSLLDEAQARLPAGSLSLLIDEDGAALEASRANIFALRGRILSTPPIDGSILPGITRERVLGIASELGLETAETRLSRHDLLAADEVFLTGSVRGVERVRSIDRAKLSGAGTVASELGAELGRAWAAVQVG